MELGVRYGFVGRLFVVVVAWFLLWLFGRTIGERITGKVLELE